MEILIIVLTSKIYLKNFKTCFGVILSSKNFYNNVYLVCYYLLFYAIIKVSSYFNNSFCLIKYASDKREKLLKFIIAF